MPQRQPLSKPSKKVSGHRLLTSDAIIEEKRREAAEKASKEQRKIERATKRENMKLLKLIENKWNEIYIIKSSDGIGLLNMITGRFIFCNNE